MERTIMLNELIGPFFNNRPSSFLIRGLPGSGKTMLSFEILNMLKEKYNCGLVLSRQSLAHLWNEIPWSKDLIVKEPKQLSERNQSTTSLVLGMECRENSTINIVEKLVAFIDGMKGKEEKDSFIIIDSLDTFTKELPLGDKLSIERTIGNIIKNTNNCIGFISEESKLNTLAYEVDGIFTLSSEVLGGTRIRKLLIDKMRGVSISRPSCYFTLHDAHFTLLNIFKTKNKFPSPCLFEPLPSPQGYVSSGNKKLDSVLGGGIKRGTVLIVEIDNDVNRKALSLFLASIVLNSLRSGIPAIIVPNADRSYHSVMNYLDPFCTKDELERLTLFSYDAVKDIPCILPLGEDISENEKNFEERYAQMLKYKKPILVSYDLGGRELATNHLDTLLKSLLKYLRRVRGSGDIEIIIERSNLKTLPFALNVADIHIKLWQADNTVFLKIIRPYADTFALVEDNAKGYPSYFLYELQ